jgi:tetratricopeptide (TPR) repeat protein
VFLSALGACGQSLEQPEFYDGPVTRWLKPSVSHEISNAITKHEYAQAEEMLIESIKSHPPAIELLSVLGAVFFLDAKYLNCASALEKVNAAGALNEQSRFTLVMAYVNLNRFDLARPELRTLIRTTPGNSLYHYWRGRLDFIDQKFESSIESLQVATSLNPHFARAHDLLGLCHEALAEPEKASDEFRRAVKLNREEQHPSAWPPFNFGEHLYKLGQLDQAQDFIKESLSYEPAFAKAHFQLGLLYEKLGHDDAAVQELRTAIALDKHSPEPYYALTRILKRQGNSISAQDAARQFEVLSKQQNGGH